MAELDSAFVKRGLWTNLDQGPIMGKTITTDTTTGNLIVALLAVLSTLGTAHLWHLVTFIIHQLRANGRPSDALFHQQQVLLRTLPTPGTVMVDALKLWWAWKREVRRPFLRSILLIILALLFSVSTVAASIFSSLVVDASNLVVLVDSPHCGWAVSSKIDRINMAGPALNIATPYARKCYGNESFLAVCNIFVRRDIQSSSKLVPCPFASGWCEGGEAISLDSGLVDVSNTFGLNIPSTSGVKFRKKSTCAVLPLGNRTQVVNMTDYPMATGRTGLPGEEALLLNYGKQTRESGNATFVASLTFSNMTDNIYVLPALVHYSSPSAQNYSTFAPIPELGHNDSNLMISAISFNSALWMWPYPDPLFSAHRDITITSSMSGQPQARNESFWTADFPLKAIACLEQYQFCYARTSTEDVCTDLKDLPDQLVTDAFPGANKVQQKLLNMLISASYAFGILSPGSLEIDSLRDNNRIITPHVEDNARWIFELRALQNKVWATLQVFIADFALGDISRPAFIQDVSVNGTKTRATPEEETTLCASQKMKKSGGIVNINVFGLAFIIAFSLLVSLIDITLLKFLVFLSRFRRTLDPRIDRWVQDGVWQLQRRAYEGQGHRGWIDVEKDIPMTTDKRMLVGLPILWTPNKPGDQGSVVGSSRSLRSMGSVRSYGRSPEITGWI